MKVVINKYEDIEDALFELGMRESSIAKKEASMNTQITQLKETFATDTAKERAEADLLRKKIEEFCYLNKKDFDKVRSKEFTHGILAFRNNPPKVSQLNRKYTMKTSMELIKKIFKAKYIRAKEEIDKELILSDYAKEEIDDSKLASVGLCIDQGETFGIDINWESIK